MSTEQSEAFEKWWRAPEQHELRISCAEGWGFRIWQASRAALVLYFPEPFQLASSHSGIAYYYASEVDKAISAAGITVKEG